MNVIEAVMAQMEAEGCNGLYGDDCACDIYDIKPCDSDISYCEFGVKIDCRACSKLDGCGDVPLGVYDYDYFIVPIGYCEMAVKAAMS